LIEQIVGAVAPLAEQIVNSKEPQER
jgi:hypothetical protein